MRATRNMSRTTRNEIAAAYGRREPRFTDIGIAVKMATPSAEVAESSVTVTTDYGFRKG